MCVCVSQSACDEQRPKAALAADFPHVDFSLVADSSPWTLGDITEDRVAWRRRLATFEEWLRARPERYIAVCM